MPKSVLAGIRVSSAVLLAAVAAAPPPASAQTPRSAASTADYSQEAVVLEQVRTLLRFEDDGTGRREIYMRLRAQSEAGVQQYGQLVFGYNSANERAEVAFVRVRKPDGTVVETPQDAVQDLSSPVQRIAPIYTDFRQKHVTVQSLRPGDVLELSVVTAIHTALAPNQFWTEYDFLQDAIVLDEQLDVDLPANRVVTLEMRPGFDATPKDIDGRRVYHWSRSQLKRASDKKAEDDAKSDAAKAQAAKDVKVPAVRVTTFQTWEQVGKWYAALEATQRAPTPEVRKRAAELTAGLTTDLEKIEALYTYVATNFRYVSLSLGAGRYQPRSADDVLHEQYGDCKDKHTLLASLLDAIGVKASAVLINTSAKLDPDFPSPSQFDHVITLAVAGSEEVWVDTTTEVAPFRLLIQPLRNKQALVVDSAGIRLRQTPANPPMKSILLQDVDATLASNGKLDARVRLTMRGDMELLMRTVFRMSPAARWKEIIEEFAQGLGTQGDVANWKVSEPAAVRDPFTIEFDLSVARYADWSSKRVSVRLPLAASALGEKPDDGDDTEPLALGAAPMELSYKLRLGLPADVTARAPVPVTIGRDYAGYRATYAVSAATLTAERIVSIQQSEIPADRKQDYAAFLKVVAADSGQMLALETSSPVSSTAPADLTAAQLNRSGYDALQAGNFAQAIALLKRAVELEPKDKVAWTNLGRAHMGLRETDAAIAAFQKQIEINPYDQYAYNNLGLAYVARQDYEKAEAAFLKQLEVNPLDKFAPSSLGALYLERRQYDRAADQFEKGIALDPDNSWLHVQNGKARLNLKQVEQAIAAFDRAVELAPNPLTWNNIAYELALTGVRLDRAQQYAESAVSSASAASRNLDVARGDQTSLSVVRSLASYWDTLGWVHYARGEMTRAIPYVEMAWKLSQHAEVGDHLAQIYEKQGLRDEAIRTYALALAAPRPSDDVRKRLAAILGDAAKVGTVVDSHRMELASMRTIRVDGKVDASRTAEFLVLFSAPAAVESVRFVSGDEALRPLADAIRAASFGRLFPDDAPAKILRRGLLACSPASGCSFTLLLPDDAEPVK